jgi:6-phosphogluconolactonase
MLFAFIGTYTQTGSDGIYVCRVDPDTGVLTPISSAKTPNPTFLALHPNGRFLYAANELDADAAAVTAYAIHPATAALTELNQQPTHAPAPCHVVVDATGRWLIAANYGNGDICVYPIQNDVTVGALGPLSQRIQQTSQAANTERQEGPHGHSVTLDAANRFAFACDLGLDRVFIYRLDGERGALLPHGEARLAAGAGPRHFAFHPSGAFAYVINELDNTITAFAYDAVRGELRTLQTLGTLPAGYTATSYCADVHVHPSGQFLYGSNRGHNSLAIFGIDQASGQLSPIGHQPVGGDWPRNFALHPTARWLYAANQNSDTIVQFEVNPTSGLLKPTGHVLGLPRPVCVKFLVM